MRLEVIGFELVKIKSHYILLLHTHWMLKNGCSVKENVWMKLSKNVLRGSKTTVVDLIKIGREVQHTKYFDLIKIGRGVQHAKYSPFL